MKFKKELILAVILFFGLFLRVYALGSESIWQDEGFSVSVAHMNLSELIATTAADVHPPLYYLLLHYWISIFGDSEFSCRFLSALFGFFSIVMIYKVGSLLFHRDTGLLGALVLALSEFHIHYSQVARMYSLMVLLTLLSFYYFIRLRREKGVRSTAGYMVWTILLMYTHIYGLFIVMAQNIYAISASVSSKNKTALGKWIALQAILLSLYLPWLHSLMGQVMKVEEGYWIPAPTLFSIVVSFTEYAGSVYSLLLLVLPVFLLLVPLKRYTENVRVTNHVAPVGYPSGQQEESAFWSITLLSIWLFTPIVMPFIISLFSRPIYHFRYTIGASVAFYLLAAAGIDRIRSKPAKMLLICAIVLSSLANVWGYYKTTHKAQWREVGMYLNEKAKSGDLVLIIPRGGRTGGRTRGKSVSGGDHPGARGNQFPALSEVAFDYYFKRPDVAKKIFRIRTEKRLRGQDIDELYPLVRNYRRVWVILRRGADIEGLTGKTLSEHYELAYSGKYVGIEVSLYVKRE